MKKDNITYLIFLIAICFTVFVSCEKDETFDCPEIEANIGDPCDGGSVVGTISEDCECVVDGPDFDCPEIEANIGDPCVNPNGVEGTISEDCVCLT